MQNIHSKVKLVIVATSFLLVAYGWIFQKDLIAIFGSILYLGAMLYSILGLMANSNKIKESRGLDHAKSKSEKITKLLEGIIVISSLIAMTLENDLYHIPGQIIWFGQIVFFILGGPIVEYFTGLPMKMTYGGWRVRNYQRKRK